MNSDFSRNDVMPYIKEKRKKSGKIKIFLLILIVSAVASLVFVIYRSGRELFEFFEAGQDTSFSSETTSHSEQAVTTAATEDVLGARKIIKKDMSAFSVGQLYENETEFDVFPSSFDFAALSGTEISVLVICSRGFETYLENEALYMNGDYPDGEKTVSADICARNIAANLTIGGIGALYIDVGNTSAYKSYENSSRKINECLALYPNVKYVIDVRRGVYYDGEGNFICPSFSCEGRDTAQIRFEVGAGSANCEIELSIADTLFSEMQKKERFSVMPTRIKRGKLASVESVPVITLEIGSAVTSAESALYAAEIFAEVFLQAVK